MVTGSITLYNLYYQLEPFYPFMIVGIGVCFFIFVQCLNETLFPKPPLQVKRSISESSKGRIKPKKSRKFEKEVIDQEKLRFKREFINSSYKRLGIAGSYVTYENDVYQSAMVLRLFILVVSSLVAVLVGMSVSALIGVSIFLLGLYCMTISEKIADSNNMSRLKSDIKKLNLYQRLEIDLLMTRFMAIIEDANTNSATTTISKYIETSTACRNDLNTFLADSNLNTLQEALDKWRDRITAIPNHNMQDVVRFIEKLKKMYIQGDTYGLYTEMYTIRNMLIENYYRPYIDKIKRKRTGRLLGLLIFMASCVFMVILIPLILEVIGSLGEIKGLEL